MTTPAPTGAKPARTATVGAGHDRRGTGHRTGGPIDLRSTGRTDRLGLAAQRCADAVGEFPGHRILGPRGVGPGVRRSGLRAVALGQPQLVLDRQLPGRRLLRGRNLGHRLRPARATGAQPRIGGEQAYRGTNPTGYLPYVPGVDPSSQGAAAVDPKAAGSVATAERPGRPAGTPSVAASCWCWLSAPASAVGCSARRSGRRPPGGGQRVDPASASAPVADRTSSSASAASTGSVQTVAAKLLPSVVSILSSSPARPAKAPASS